MLRDKKSGEQINEIEEFEILLNPGFSFLSEVMNRCIYNTRTKQVYISIAVRRNVAYPQNAYIEVGKIPVKYRPSANAFTPCILSGTMILGKLETYPNGSIGFTSTQNNTTSSRGFIIYYL